MNKKIIIPLALAPLAAPALQAQHQQPNGRTDTRPNIILFMSSTMKRDFFLLWTVEAFGRYSFLSVGRRCSAA